MKIYHCAGGCGEVVAKLRKNVGSVLLKDVAILCPNCEKRAPKGIFDDVITKLHEAANLIGRR